MLNRAFIYCVGFTLKNTSPSLSLIWSSIDTIGLRFVFFLLPLSSSMKLFCEIQLAIYHSDTWILFASEFYTIIYIYIFDDNRGTDSLGYLPLKTLVKQEKK